MADGRAFDEALAICLDALDGGAGVPELLRRYPEYAQELEPLLDAAVWFSGQAAALMPRPGFVQASRKRLVKQIAAPPPVTGSLLSRTLASLGSGWRIALQVGVAAVMLACLVLGSTGIAYASQEALPGDPLYPVKLGLEQVELMITLDEEAELRLHLQFSQLRITEMQRLLALGRYKDLEIATAKYRYHLSQALRLLGTLAGQDPASAQSLALEVANALNGQADTLNVLADIVPEEAQAELEETEQAARQAAQRAQEIGQAIELPQSTEVTGGENDPRATATPTAPPTATVASFAMPSATPTPTPTQTPSPTPTSNTTLTPTRTPLQTGAATVKPSATPTLRADGTLAPTPTRTQQPTPTRTGQPTPTRTSPPTPTRTGQPSPTQTLPPTSTRTLPPTPTATLPPATPTATDIPPTSTTAPTPTRTPRPTPTSTPVPTPYPEPGTPPQPIPEPGPGPYPPPN